jgi:hypothetical protein
MAVLQLPGFTISTGLSRTAAKTIPIPWNKIKLILNFTAFPVDGLFAMVLEVDLQANGTWKPFGASITGPGVPGNVLTGVYEQRFNPPQALPTGANIRAMFLASADFAVTDGSIEAT